MAIAMSDKSLKGGAMKHLFNLLIVVAMALTTGCAAFDNTVLSMFESVGITPDYRRGQGHAQVFNAPIEEVWNALPRAMISLGLPEVHHSDNHVSARKGSARLRSKECCANVHYVFFFVDSEGENRTRVEVISAHPMHPVEKIKWLHKHWGPEVMQKIEQLLLQGKQEQPRQSNPSPMPVQQ